MAELVLSDYQDCWPKQFNDVATQVLTVFENSTVFIEHIGSTSVPGLIAKPVLDLLLGAESLNIVEDKIKALADIGFVYRPEYEQQLPARRYFVRPSASVPRVHLHAVIKDGPLWCDHIAFRDAIRESASLRDQYAELKKSLARQFANNKALYSEAKGPFIHQVLTKCKP